MKLLLLLFHTYGRKMMCVFISENYVNVFRFQDSRFGSPAAPLLENPEIQTRWYFKYFLGKGRYQIFFIFKSHAIFVY